MHTSEEVLSKFIKIQNLLKPDISVEIGAFDADFSMSMSQFDIEVFAFEASPFVYKRYKDNLKSINYINKAVSDKNGTISFEVQPGNDPSVIGNNSIKNRNMSADYKYIDVESVSIDEYFKEKQFSNGVMWIDVEGASREVLTGSTNRLKDFSSICIELELEDFWKDAWKRDDVVSFLESNGFCMIHESYAYNGQNDAIFIKKEYVGSINEILSE